MTHAGSVRRRLIAPWLALCLGLAASPALAALDTPLYTALLERHTRAVDDLARVRVDYTGLRADPDWKRLVASLATADPAGFASRAERIAFWANAYNILAIDLVIAHYPVASIRDIGSLFRPVWKQPAGVVGGRSYSLDQIEHGIVRPLGDPRSHVAVVCASLSCPPLLREPWRADRLDAQLDAALRRWLADPRKGARIDRARSRVALSRIFDWFEEDFEPAGGALAFVAAYLPSDDAAWLRAQGSRVSVDYLDYDWRLNDLATRPAARASGAAAYAGRLSRRVTNSSADVGWMPSVASKSALVAPHLIATAMPWITSAAFGPSICAPTTRCDPRSTTSLTTVCWSRPDRVCLSSRKRAR